VEQLAGPAGDEIARAVPSALERHPAIREVVLVGSRAEGRAHDISDWDFAVETDDFASVARELPRLVARLDPIAEQWDPYATHACYMLMLRGPAKVDLLFPDEKREWSPPWVASRETLEAMDHHFWDWILWLEQKRTGGHADVLAQGLEHMHACLLRSLGVAAEPRSIAEATALFVEARGRLESAYGVFVSRALEEEVLPAVLRRQP
jgi:hypothetical protein